MRDLFLSVLEVSLSAGVIILILLALSPVLNRRYAAKWKYGIWILLALRLAVPVKLELPRQRIELNIPAPVTEYIAVDVGTVIPLAPEIDTRQIMPLDVLAVLWLAGVAVFLLVHLISYWRFRSEMRRSGRPVTEEAVLRQVRSISEELGIHREVPVLQEEKAASPMVMGFFRPLLILPELDFGPMELYFVLKHELVHLKRQDIFAKFLFVFANAVHWFNPLVYLMQREAVVDMELSCDERVVRGTVFETRKAYTETLLSTMCRRYQRSTTLTTEFYGGTKIMKKRFKNILNRTRKRNGMVVLLLVITVTLALGMVTGCAVEEKEQPIVETVATEPQTVTEPYTGAGTMDPEQKELKEAGSVALKFAMERFRNDMDAMCPYLSPDWEGMFWDVSFDEFPVESDLEVKGIQRPGDISLSGTDPVSIYHETVPVGSTTTMAIEVNDVNDSDTFFVCLIRLDNGWKVYDFGFEKTEGFGQPKPEPKISETMMDEDIPESEPAVPGVTSEDKEVLPIWANDFSEFYFAGDTEGMKAFLSDTSVYDGGYQGAGPVEINAIKWADNYNADENKVTLLTEFREADAHDSFTYLRMEFVKKYGAWKINWYGLEK